MSQRTFGTRNKIGLVLGLVLFVVVLLLDPPAGLSTAGWHTVALALLMACWWITEAIPISATALLPILLIPILGIDTIDNAVAPFANPLVYLFLGGFMIAIAMQRWDLHRRIALNIINTVGTSPSRIIIGFILASAFLSMWVSNTATSLMMLPIALSVLDLVDRGPESTGKYNFEIVLVLCIAYACNIGGVGTLIGTPPNALLAGFMDSNYGVELGFMQWMMVGVPVMIVSLPLLYLILTKVVYPINLKEIPGGKELINQELADLGKITNPEIKVAIVFVSTALLWISRPLITNVIPELSDTGIAIAASISLFLIPVDQEESSFVLDWKNAENLPWGILILFGGGLSLAAAISNTGLAEWVGSGVAGLEAWPIMLLVSLTILIIIFLTEITSNMATTAAFLPILASVALGLGENPLLLTVPAALAASCAFMLPVATPPNAIIYGTGKITIPEMSKAGLWLNMLFLVIVSITTFTLILFIFNIELGVPPAWAN